MSAPVTFPCSVNSQTLALTGCARGRRRRRLDLAVSDLGPTQLKNISEPIRVFSLDVSAPAVAKAAPAPVPERSAAPRLSVVVLPFANIGGGAEQEHFVDGATESLTTRFWYRASNAFASACDRNVVNLVI